jgi:hypothetical protein
MKRIVFVVSLILFLSLAIAVSADSVGEKRSFYIEPDYDKSDREKVTAVLVKITSKLYFYVDETWWNFTTQNEVYQILSELGGEFDDNIYPVLTSTFGPEWNPGIDKDSRITVLIHPMKEEAGGYFSTKDEYSEIEVSNSNKREMIYLNSNYIDSSYNKSFLAHEFVHLITFNQKDNTYNISEEVWLNEARAEYTSTLVGYDDEYEGSKLENRVKIFSEYPSDPMIEWQNKKEDYGVLNLFTQYLVDHYGVEILVDSLQSPETGIESINLALEKNGFDEDFSKIFLDFSIAILINDCNYGSKYCFFNDNLKNIHVVPKTSFLSLTAKSTLSISDVVKNWSGNWYKIIGGKNDLKLEFISSAAQYFTVPYIAKNRNGAYFVNFLELNGSQKVEVNIKDFGTDIIALYIIPLVNKTNNDSYYPYSWTVSTVESTVIENEDESELINELLAQIELLTQEIARVQAQINSILTAQNQFYNKPIQNLSQDCQIKNNLRFGLMNNSEVSCLQEFLKEQGEEIYPLGLVTGNFLSLTKEAVARFQEKYASEILKPFNLEQGTGFVGIKTRTKINQLLNFLGF